MLVRVHRLLTGVEAVWSAATSLALYAVMIIVSVDVVLRYLLHRTLPWSYDLISMYLMTAIFLLPLSRTLRENHHVRVDVLFGSASPRVRHVLELIGYVLTAAVMAGILYKGTAKAWSSYQAGDVVVTAYAWPMWIAAALVPLGVGLLLLRLLFGICSLAVALAIGASHVTGIDQSSGKADA
jgi:TRAP-type mannitol/chloroaromatic compound transport system permease small subunit